MKRAPKGLSKDGKAKAEAEKVMRVVGPLRAAGQTLSTIAETLSAMGIKTSRGGNWSATQVMRVLNRSDN